MYEPKTVLLGSRDHLCLNPKLKDKKGTDLREACRSCRKNWEFYDIHKIKDYANKEALTSFAHIEDIEDLRLHGKRKKICPYYLQQNRHKYADLILMPYNYIVDPKIRENFEIKFENSIIIIDEGHNITDVCESSASCQIDTSMLWATNTELEKLMNKISDYNSFKTEHYKIFKNIFNSNDSQINYDLVTTHQEWKKLKNIVWKMALNLENFSKESYLGKFCTFHSLWNLNRWTHHARDRYSFWCFPRSF